MKKSVADEVEKIKTSTSSTRKRTTSTRRTTTTRTATSKSSAMEKTSKTKAAEKNPFVFTLNTALSLLEICANDDVYEIYVGNDEYVLFLGKNSSYFSSAQDNLFLKNKSSDISISKEDGIYRISTNLDVEISDNVAFTNFGKTKDHISFSTADCFKVSAKLNKLSITSEVYNKNKFLTNLSVPNSSNNCLIISDEDQKVYLPYSFEEVDKKFKKLPDKYDSITDLIEKEYIKPASFYKNPFTARFREAYKLMRRRQHGSIGAALALGVELAFETHLHPAIITACKNVEELDIYLDCLDDNELDKFSCFDIIYKSVPVVLAAREKGASF
jgi:hypothetical protein